MIAAAPPPPAGLAISWIAVVRSVPTYRLPSGPSAAYAGRWSGSTPASVTASTIENEPLAGFQRRRSTLRLPVALSGTYAISSPLLGAAGVGSWNTGAPALAGPGRTGTPPPRHVAVSIPPGAAGAPTGIRQKPARWSETHHRPSGDWTAPAGAVGPSTTGAGAADALDAPASITAQAASAAREINILVEDNEILREFRLSCLHLRHERRDATAHDAHTPLRDRAGAAAHRAAAAAPRSAGKPARRRGFAAPRGGHLGRGVPRTSSTPAAAAAALVGALALAAPARA